MLDKIKNSTIGRALIGLFILFLTLAAVSQIVIPAKNTADNQVSINLDKTAYYGLTGDSLKFQASQTDLISAQNTASFWVNIQMLMSYTLLLVVLSTLLAVIMQWSFTAIPWDSQAMDKNKESVQVLATCLKVAGFLVAVVYTHVFILNGASTTWGK